MTSIFCKQYGRDNCIRAAFAVLLIGVMLITDVFSVSLTDALSYQRDAVQSAQWWRLYTGNYVHFGHYHTFMNIAGLAVTLYLVFWHLPPRVWLAAIIAVPLAIGLGLYLWDDGLQEYRGFSGALYGFLALGFALNLMARPVFFGAALLLLTAKIVYEQLPDYDVFYLAEEIGVPVAINAHLYGFLAGLAVAVTSMVFRWTRGVRRVLPKA